jgi:hypothetical protein
MDELGENSVKTIFSELIESDEWKNFVIFEVLQGQSS